MRRFEAGVLFGFLDLQSSTTTLVGLATPIADLCAGAEPFGQAIEVQQLDKSSGQFHEVDIGRDMPVVIYKVLFFQDPLAEPCALARAPILATGTARLTSDIVFFPDGSGQLDQRAQGTVTYTSGGKGQLTASGKVTFGPGGDVTDGSGHVRLTPAQGG